MNLLKKGSNMNKVKRKQLFALRDMMGIGIVPLFLHFHVYSWKPIEEISSLLYFVFLCAGFCISISSFSHFHLKSIVEFPVFWKNK